MSTSTPGITPGAELVARIKAADKRKPTVILSCATDYPHRDQDPTGELALNWLERQRRGVCTAARRAGLTGTTTIKDGCIEWRPTKKN